LNRVAMPPNAQMPRDVCIDGFVLSG
jgi:hypothetical protein